MPEQNRNPTRTHFLVQDNLLREEIEQWLRPHFPDPSEIGFHSGGAETCPPTYVMAVCVSELPSDSYVQTILSAHERKVACGIIVRVQSRATWQKLAELHMQRRFCFVVAVGGPREGLNKMFPRAAIEPVAELKAPGRHVARFIWNAAEAYTPLPLPYASNS